MAAGVGVFVSGVFPRQVAIAFLAAKDKIPLLFKLPGRARSVLF